MTLAPKDPSEEIDEAAEKASLEKYGYLNFHFLEEFKAGAAFGQAIGARKEREKILGMLREIGPYDGPYRDGDGFADWIEERLK